MENEICENCGRAIGSLEQAFVYKGHIVCKECNKKLSDEPQEMQSSRPRVERAFAKLVFAEPALPNAQRGKMTRSKILWLALGGWSTILFLLIIATVMCYESEAAKYHPLSGEHWASEAACGFWVFVLAFIWFLGALPLFIAAIVTRKGKNAITS